MWCRRRLWSGQEEVKRGGWSRRALKRLGGRARKWKSKSCLGNARR